MTSSSLILAAVVAASVAGAACAGAQSAEQGAETETEQTAAPETDGEMAAYALGLDIARQLTAQGIELSEEHLIAGLSDGLNGEEPPVPAAELQAARQRFQEAEKARIAEKQQARAATERAAGEAFLSENVSEQGVETLAPGLQYQVLTAGEGEKPQASDRVTVHYRGTLLDGTEFDSSYARNQPVTFPLNQVIPGWTQALTQMPVGSKWKLFIGPDLGYGDTPPPGSPIPPGATLIFEVELIEIAQ